MPIIDLQDISQIGINSLLYKANNLLLLNHLKVYVKTIICLNLNL